MKIVIDVKNNWMVNEVRFVQEPEETMEQFRIAVNNSLLYSTLNIPGTSNRLINEVIQKGGKEPLTYAVAGNGFLLCFAVVPRR